jgi:hypothetical protein
MLASLDLGTIERAAAGLFDGDWLFADPARAPEEAGRRSAEGLDRFRQTLEAHVLDAGKHNEAGNYAVPDALIDGLLRLETHHLPLALKEAKDAIDRFTQNVAFKRRELMPRLPGLNQRVRGVHHEARRCCRDQRWRLMILRAHSEPTVAAGPMQGHHTDFHHLAGG